MAIAREAGPVVPAIRADDSESTEEDMTLKVTLAERSSGSRQVDRPIPQLRDEEDEEEEVAGETRETLVDNTGEEGGEGETQETGETEEVSEAEQAGPSSVVARRWKKKENPVVINAVNIAVRGEVSYLASTMTTEDLDWIEAMNGGKDIVWQLPTHEEVACSDASPEVCLYEHMFFWGMRLRADPIDRPRGFVYLAMIISSYGLSPGQLTANAFLTILGFWGFIWSRMEKDTPMTVGPFAYFYELKEKKKQGRYHFATRKYVPTIHGLTAEEMAILRNLKPLVGLPSNQKGYQQRYFFVSFESNPFITKWSRVDTSAANRVAALEELDVELMKKCASGTLFSVQRLKMEDQLAMLELACRFQEIRRSITCIFPLLNFLLTIFLCFCSACGCERCSSRE